MSRSKEGYIPAGIRKHSRVVAWLWVTPYAERWLSWEGAVRLARWLP